MYVSLSLFGDDNRSRSDCVRPRGEWSRVRVYRDHCRTDLAELQTSEDRLGSMALDLVNAGCV